MTVVEISECFPNAYKPVTGEFISQHVRALSEYCKVITIVPLRFVPPKELFSLNLFKTFSNIIKWLSSRIKTKNINQGNLQILYTGFISLPRPFFEPLDNYIIKFFFYNKIKNILKGNDPDLIYCNWLRPWSEISFRLSRHFKIPFIIDHHEDLPSLKKSFPNNYRIFLKAFEKADGIVVHSAVNKKDLEDEHLSVPGIRINHLGQNYTVNKAVKEFSSNKLNLVCISHLYESRKNLDDLIKAIAEIKNEIDLQLTIAGEGILKKDYIKLANSLNLSNKIIFTGEKSKDEINDLLEDSDIFVLPSFPEAFGVVFIEALAKGLPVITCEGNGGGEELKNLGYPVVLVKPNSPQDLSAEIIKLYNDKAKMEEMSRAGKELVKNNFTWEKNAQSTYEYLEEIVNNFKILKK